MNYSKIDAALIAKMSEDQTWLLPGEFYTVIVTLNEGSPVAGKFSAKGIADLTNQSWVKAIRLTQPS